MDAKRICALECGAKCCTNSGEILLREGEAELYLGLAKEREVDLKVTDGFSGSQYINLPCPFLENGTICSIHEQKPSPCKTYPWKKMDGCMLTGWTPPPQVFVGVPRGNRRDDEFQSSFDAMLAAMRGVGILHREILNAYSCRVDNNRNTIGLAFLKDTRADYLMMVDDDMQFHPNTALILVVTAIAQSCPIIGGVYFQRTKQGMHPHVYSEAGMAIDRGGEVGHTFSWDETMTTLRNIYLEHHVGTDKPQLVQSLPLLQVDATGTGCIMIRRDVLEQTPYPWFRNEYGTGGDLMFCAKAKRAGFQTYTAAGVICTHNRPGAVGVESFLDDIVPSGEGGPVRIKSLS